MTTIDPYGPMMNTKQRRDWTVEEIRALNVSTCAADGCTAKVQNKKGNLCNQCIIEMVAIIEEAKYYGENVEN